MLRIIYDNQRNYMKNSSLKSNFIEKIYNVFHIYLEKKSLWYVKHVTLASMEVL